MPFIQDNSVQPLNPKERRAANAAKKAGGFFQRLGEDLNKRKQNVMSDAKEFSQGKISSQEYRVRGAGQVAGGFTDVVGNVVGTAAKAGFKALPQQRQEALKSDAATIAQSKFGQAIGKTASSVASKYGQFRESNPRLAKDIEAVGNIASAVPIGFGTKQVGSQSLKTAQYVGEETGTGVRRMLTGSLENNVGKAVGMTGRMGLADTEKAIPRAVNAFRTIAKNAKNTMVKDIDGIEKVFEPTKATFGETLQALKQTKDGLYNQWTKMAKEAGEQGVSFGAQDFQKAIESLRKSTANSTTAWRNKAETLIGDMTRNYADETPNGVVFREVDPSDIQKFIENINVDINPMSDKAGSEVSSLLSRTLREMMDKKIESTGPGYQALRNQYSDLKSVENGLINQFKKSARGVGNGFPQWVEGFGTLDAIVGMVTQGPQAAIRGVGLNILAKTMRSLRDPENALKRSFKEILRETNPMNKPAVIKGLESLKGKGGLNLNDVSGGKKGYSSSLLQEARKGEVLYHGTNADIKGGLRLGKDGSPIWLSKSQSGGERYGKNLIKVSPENAKLLDETSLAGLKESRKILEESGATSFKDAKFQTALKNAGYDGLRLSNGNDVAIFNPDSLLYNKAQGGAESQSTLLQEAPSLNKDIRTLTIKTADGKTEYVAQIGDTVRNRVGKSTGGFKSQKTSPNFKNQGEADKWIKENTKGLGEKSESPLIQEARKYKSAEEFVKAQGEPSYHGTSAKFDKFDPKKRGSAQGFDEPGVSFTTDKESAARYDLRFPRKPRYSWTDADKEAAKNANVVEAYFDKRNPLTFDELNNLYADGKIKTAPKSEVNGAGFVRPEQFIDNNRQAIKEASDITGKKVFKVTAEGQTNYMVTDESLIKTKSQLTDLYNKAQEKRIDTSLTEQPKPDVTPKKESGYAKSLEEKAVEKKMASEFQDLAEYTPAVRKEQAQMTTKLINEDIEKVNSILDGKAELPSGMRGSSLALAVEQHAIVNNDVKLLQKLAKSKIATGISEAGSELSMLAGRNANSPVRIIRNIIKARKENIVKRLKGKKISEARKVTKESIKKAIKKEAPTKETWSNFIKEIKC